MKKKAILLLGATTTAAIIVNASPTANAEPFNDPAHQHDMAQICIRINNNPSYQGLNNIAVWWSTQRPMNVDADSWSTLGAQTLADAVTYDCPEYTNLINGWINTPIAPDPQGRNKSGVV